MQGCRVFCDSLYTGFCRRSFGWHCVKRSRQLANVRWLHRKTCDRSMAAHHNYPKHPPKADDLTAIRNIGVMAHIDAGKTTTTERMLYYSGFSNHLGDVDDGDTVMDYMEQERSRGITITSAAITFPWKHHKINLIDTPGHVDFTFEVERSLRAIDGAVAILDASAGVEAQTLTVWRQADRYSVPRIIYLNKMDKRGASIELCVKSISEKLNVRPLMLHMPIGNEREFQGIVDLVTMETAIWSKGNTGDGREFKLASINQSKTSSVWAKALKARTSLIGQLADLDERIAELVLSDVAVEKIPVSDVISALKRVTINQTAVPVLIGSSLKNKGVQHLLDGVNHFLPSPLDCHHPFAEFYGDELCALAFKITHDKQRGALTFLRLYSGNLKMGAGIYNVTRQTTEKIGRLLHVYANTHKDVNHVNAGNIVCVTGLNQTITGDILTSSHAAYKKATQQYGHQAGVDHNEGGSSEPFTPLLSIPSPVFFCSIEPQSATVQKQLDIALANLQREDNSLRVTVDKDTGQTVLSGMGELHMEIIKDRIKQEYGIEVDLGPLQVAYKETITDSAEVTEVLDRTLGDSRHFVTMTMSVRPDQGAMDFTTVDLVHSRENNLEVLKRHHLQAINNGVSLGLASGPVLNFPVSGVAVQLLHFETTSKTSLAMVSACASQAVHKALSNAAAILLEPMMHLEITTDEDHLHAVLTDLSQRRSHINAVHPRDTIRVVSAMTPLAEMMGYSTSLRTITSGTAVFFMELSRYEAMNIADQKRAIEKVTGFMPE